jgi:hypothetical protein
MKFPHIVREFHGESETRAFITSFYSVQFLKILKIKNGMNHFGSCHFMLVPKTGLEPVHPCGR